MTEIELAEYANEHFLYELLMLRYSKHHLQVCRDRLRWNAMFAAFNVSARNFYDFLRGDEDNRNVQLKDFDEYSGSWRPSSAAAISPTVNKLNMQCLHFGKKRTSASDDKVTLERIIDVFEWADSNLVAFIRSLSFSDAIDLRRADPQGPAALALMLSPPQQSSATNIPGTVTSMSESITYSVKMDEQS